MALDINQLQRAAVLPPENLLRAQVDAAIASRKPLDAEWAVGIALLAWRLKRPDGCRLIAAAIALQATEQAAVMAMPPSGKA